MKPIDIYIDGKAQRGFKRRAVAAFHKNLEYMEAIFVRRGVGEFHVEKFIKLNLTKQGEDIVDADEVQYRALKLEAKNAGLEFATIHTHIYGDSSPSEWDFKETVKEGEVLIGVCFIWRDEKTERVKTRIEFWQPQLPCEMKVINAK